MILRSEYDIIKFVFELKDLDFSKPHLATVEPYDPNSSNAQKKLYWKWIDIIIKTTGNFKYDQDENFREILLTPTFYTNAKKEEKTYYPRISDIGKKQMREYMTDLSILCAQYGITLPHPEDQQRNQ